jgi:8-oxo-dGTP pyrophosphatase MutT (NUDIX family)
LTTVHQKNIPLFDANLFRLVDAASQPDGTLHLTLGNTSYKEYTTTRVLEFFQDRTRQELSNALAICSVIGGFFERDLDMTVQPDPFQAMRREIREETGIQPADIREQYCLGAVYDLTTPHGEL